MVGGKIAETSDTKAIEAKEAMTEAALAGGARADGLHQASVAIVIPVHNCATFIGEAVASALAQGDLVREIVVVDDCSTDASAAVVRAIGDARVRLMTLAASAPRGVSAARNAGADAVSSPWIIYLDADDRLRPGAVAKLLAFAQERADCVAVYGDYERIDAQGAGRRMRSLIRGRMKPSGMLAERLMRGNFIVNGGVMLIRTQTMRSIGGFDETLSLCEDWRAWCRLAAAGPIHYARGLHALDYRVHSASAMMTFRRMEDFRPALDAVFSDPTLRRISADPAADRTAAEWHMRNYLATQALRARQYGAAARMLFGSLRGRPAKAPRALASALAALAGL